MSFRCVTENNLKKISATMLATTILFCCTQTESFCSPNIKHQNKKETTQTQPETIQKQDWKQTFHISFPTTNTENIYSIVQFRDNYHIFYGNPKTNNESTQNSWGHIVSTDFVNWKHLKNAIEPTNDYDKENLYAGSTIVDDELLYILYTGEQSKLENDKLTVYQTQNLTMSKDGINFGKSANNPVIAKAPNFSYLEFSTKDFRNPFVWKLEDRYYALVGSQYSKSQDGAVILFKSKDLRNWVCINVSALGQNKEIGEMWEHPALIHSNGTDVLAFSVKNIKPHGKLFLNKNQSGAFIGTLNYDTGKFSQKTPFMLFDYGFDFYAPKFIKTNDGRHIFVGNLDMENTPHYEKEKKGVFSIPRELKVENNKLITTPAKEILELRDNNTSITNTLITTEKSFPNINGETYELKLTTDMTNANSFTIKLRASEAQETTITYDKETKTLKLNRDKSGINEKGNRLSGEREIVTELKNNKLNLDIFVDKSSIELFANDGDVAMSSRIYPDKDSTNIKFSADGEAKIEQLDFYKIKPIKIN